MTTKPKAAKAATETPTASGKMKSATVEEQLDLMDADARLLQAEAAIARYETGYFKFTAKEIEIEYVPAPKSAAMQGTVAAETRILKGPQVDAFLQKLGINLPAGSTAESVAESKAADTIYQEHGQFFLDGAKLVVGSKVELRGAAGEIVDHGGILAFHSNEGEDCIELAAGIFPMHWIEKPEVDA